jgi:flagellar biogenesis protein FliO
MPNNRKWLLLPPAVALLIVLGPLSMRSDTTRATDVPQAEVADAQPLPEATPSPKGKANPLPVPRTPDLWQVTSTLIGVLLLGGATLMVLRRMRTAPTTGSTGVVTLRQTLRLAPHKTLHAVEFDGRLLLVGASEKGLQLLHAGGAAADAAADVEMTPLAKLLASLFWPGPLTLILPPVAAEANTPIGLSRSWPTGLPGMNAKPLPR